MDKIECDPIHSICLFQWQISNEDVNSFSEGLALVNNDRKYGYIDTTGKLLIPMKFTHIESDAEYAEDHSFNNDKAVIFDTKGKEFCINKQGNKVDCK